LARRRQAKKHSEVLWAVKREAILKTLASTAPQGDKQSVQQHKQEEILLTRTQTLLELLINEQEYGLRETRTLLNAQLFLQVFGVNARLARKTGTGE
tara:strand:+ start:331 stop:621 length:291 start_codon:yes stop_codon:yes gene_type:complete